MTSPDSLDRQGRVAADRAPGFTLLEMLVVLVILASMVLVTPRLGSGSPGLRIRVEAAKLVSDLRHLRQIAISQNITTGILFGPNGYELLPFRVKRTYFPNVSANYRNEIADLVGGSEAGIKFFPDGSSSGGILTVWEGQTAGIIHVRVLDGAATTDAM